MTLLEAFNEDEKRFFSLKVDSDAVMFYKGYKAIKSSDGDIKMYDTTGGGATYSEFTVDQYAMVERFGWRNTIKQLKSNQK